MSRIDLVSKNLLANYFRSCRNRNDEKIMTNSFTNIAKTASNKCNKIKGLEREEGSILLAKILVAKVFS